MQKTFYICTNLGTSKWSLYISSLAFSASYPVYAQANKSGVKTFASRQEDPSPIEITAYENRIKVENAPVGSILEIYSVVGIKVKEIEVKQSTAEYVVDISKGYYIIRIGDTVRKVAIR